MVKNKGFGVQQIKLQIWALPLTHHTMPDRTSNLISLTLSGLPVKWE